jgi:hypothetical protein
MFFCPADDSVKPCFNGQCLQEETTDVLPAAPKKQVFWTRRAKHRSVMRDQGFDIERSIKAHRNGVNVKL